MLCDEVLDTLLFQVKVYIGNPHRFLLFHITYICSPLNFFPARCLLLNIESTFTENGLHILSCTFMLITWYVPNTWSANKVTAKVFPETNSGKKAALGVGSKYNSIDFIGREHQNVQYFQLIMQWSRYLVWTPYADHPTYITELYRSIQ